MDEIARSAATFGAPSARFRVLGPLTIPGEPTPAGGRAAALLARLLLTPGRVVSIDTLIDDLWGDEPPESARLSLRVVVSRLRKSLALAGAGDVIVTRHPGYAVEVDPLSVDAGLFERAVHEGDRMLSAGRPGTAAAVLQQALGLWRGDPLAGIDAPFAPAYVARLQELRLHAMESWLAAQLACGRHAELIPELESLCAEHPLREGLWATRIVALYRANRQAEALRVYQELRELLVEELGIQPSPDLARLEAAILAQDPSLAPPSTIVDIAGTKTMEQTASSVRQPTSRPSNAVTCARRARRARCRAGRAA